MNVAADALPPKPNTAAASGTGTPTATTASFGVPLSYSAQVAEQFSSSYRQTPSQERGRLDAARLAQFNQNASAPSGSTGASLNDEQFRPVRPSEMKDEGCVFPSRSPFIFLLYPSCLYAKTKRRRMGDEGGGRLCALPPAPVFLCSDSRNSTEKQCVSYLAVVSTRTRVVSPFHLLATCFYQMLW